MFANSNFAVYFLFGEIPLIEAGGCSEALWLFFDFLSWDVLNKLHVTEHKLRDISDIFPLFLVVSNAVYTTSALYRWLPLKTSVYQNALARNINIIDILIKKSSEYPVPIYPEIMGFERKKSC